MLVMYHSFIRCDTISTRRGKLNKPKRWWWEKNVQIDDASVNKSSFFEEPYRNAASKVCKLPDSGIP